MTVGNYARTQLYMAQAQTKYGDSLDRLQANYLASGRFNKYGVRNTRATQSLEELLKSNGLRNKGSEYRSRFTDLYKSIYGVNDDSSEDTTASAQSIKAASAQAGSAAESIKSFANNLKYGGEVDADAYRKQAQSFADSYNAMIDKVGNSDNQQVLQKGVLTVNTAKVYSSALKRAGLTVGADNKLTVNDDLSKVKAADIKTTFGSRGFSDKVSLKASQINNLTGGNGLFSPNAVAGSANASKVDNPYMDNAGTIKELTAQVKELATAVKTYAQGLGSEDKAYSVQEYQKAAGDFIDKYNNLVDEAGKSDNFSVRSKGETLQYGAKAYKYSLQKAGINVDSNGKLSLADKAKLEKLENKDLKYSLGKGGFLDKVTEKANQMKSLVSSAYNMGYNSNRTSNYAYNSGALYSVYA